MGVGVVTPFEGPRAEWTVLTGQPQSASANQTNLNATDTIHQVNSSRVEKRADGKAIQVVSGDFCASLSSRCGIRGADFTKYNPKQNLYSTLMVK
jgi:hypothetical protein